MTTTDSPEPASTPVWGDDGEFPPAPAEEELSPCDRPSGARALREPEDYDPEDPEARALGLIP